MTSIKQTLIQGIHWAQSQRKLLVGLASGVILGGSAFALAAIPDSSGVIHGCYKSNGTLSVIDTGAGQTCGSGQTALNWNQTGPQGPSGPQGTTGATGPQGPQGPAGSSGVGGFVSNLVGANFNGASLQYRDFSGADLHDAHFSGSGSQITNVTGASFHGANLSNTVFSTITGLTDFSGANLSGSNFTVVQDTNNASNNFQSANLSGATLIHAVIGDFRNAIFTGTIFNASTTFNQSNYSGVDLTSATLGGTFSNSDLSSANLSGLHINLVTFSSDNLNSANFTNVQFTNSNFTGTSDLSTANLTGATWSNTICPDGTNSDNNSNTCIGHLAP